MLNIFVPRLISLEWVSEVKRHLWKEKQKQQENFFYKYLEHIAHSPSRSTLAGNTKFTYCFSSCAKSPKQGFFLYWVVRRKGWKAKGLLLSLLCLKNWPHVPLKRRKHLFISSDPLVLWALCWPTERRSSLQGGVGEEHNISESTLKNTSAFIQI